uniref:Uncharacterized protein n=1 Tax=Talaromyces marneffei PM1 TaxID=1077442 RepID=A0A093XI15_TALMA
MASSITNDDWPGVNPPIQHLPTTYLPEAGSS